MRARDRDGVGVGFVMALALATAGCELAPLTPPPVGPDVAALLAPAPRLPIGFYDYFGALKSPAEARRMVADAGLDPERPDHHARIGLVHISEQLIADGRDRFTKQFLGDPLTVNNILNLGAAFGNTVLESALESLDPAADPNGVLSFLRDVFVTIGVRPKTATTNLQVINLRDLRLGSRVFPAGSVIETGADIPVGELFPVGLEGGNVSCALCHSSVDPLTGRTIHGAPNTDLNIALFIAMSTNSAGAFLRLSKGDVDPLDDRFPRTGRLIIDSHGDEVRLPDPVAFESAVDDFVLTIPRGGFEAAPDGVTSITKIPDSFVFGEGGMGWDGGFQIGPFGGVSAFTNAVHSFEINMLGPANFSEIIAGLDREVYLGVVLQNAADPRMRIPDGVKPSEFLAANFPLAERERLVELPSYPNASLFSLNGLAFSPPDEPFMYSTNAMAAFQASLTVPPNKSLENLIALQTGAVARGAAVFSQAGCVDCHPAPFFTTGQSVANDVIKANPARGANRLVLEGLLVESVLPSFDQTVPLSAATNLMTLPPAPGAADNLSLPEGIKSGVGGYKVTGLLGLYFRAPYMHDGSVSVADGALAVSPDGSWGLVDSAGVGVPGTTKIGRRANAAHSLRAMVDRDLRAVVISNNSADEAVVRANVQGVGHEFFVDPTSGFDYEQQSDLIAFLLALDDDPGRY